MYVALIDIPIAFIQTWIANEKYMSIIKIRSILVGIIPDITPDVYEQYATTDNKVTKQLIT